MIKVDDPQEDQVDRYPPEDSADDEGARSADGEEIATDGDRTDRMSRRARITVALLTVATLALLALGVVFWLQVQGNAEQDKQRQEAVAVAKQQAIALITVNPQNVDENMRLLLENSTGEFRRQFEAASPTFEKVIKDGDVDSKGTVAEAGVVRASDDRARVLVALNSSVHNAETEKEEPRRYRLRVDLQKEADRWLVSSMVFVP